MLDGRLLRKVQEAEATPGKQVVVVEGTGDIAFLTHVLDKPPFRQRNIFADFVLLDAGGKDAVLKILGARPHFKAIVDRDTWSDAECKKLQRKYPGLYILPRYCIENFIVCPDELEQALPNFKEEAAAIAAEVPNAIRHACLWRAARPMYNELMELGFNKALMAYPPPDEAEMRRLVTSWQNLLSVDSIQSAMDEAIEESAHCSSDELLRTFCHGKAFFKGVVASYVKDRFPGETTEGLKRKLYRRIPLAEDLKALLEEVFSK